MGAVAGVVACHTPSVPILGPCLLHAAAPDHPHTQDGDEVVFSEVEGMGKLNDSKPRRVKNCKVRRLELPLRCCPCCVDRRASPSRPATTARQTNPDS